MSSKSSATARAAAALAEHAEHVLEPAGLAARGEAGARAHRADLVVLLALLGVGEHRVRLADLLELRLRLRIALVGVGVILAGELAVRLLQLGVADVLRRRRGPCRSPCRTSPDWPCGAPLRVIRPAPRRRPWRVAARPSPVGSRPRRPRGSSARSHPGSVPGRSPRAAAGRTASPAAPYDDHAELLGDGAHLVADRGEGRALDEVAVLLGAVEVVEHREQALDGLALARARSRRSRCSSVRRR